MKTKLYTLIMFAALFAVSQASAISVDFRNSYFHSFEGSSSASFIAGGVGITVQAISNMYTGSAARLNWGSDYGYGIIGGDQSDEIDTCEELLISFSEGVLLSGLSISNLHSEGFLWTRDEIGYYSLNGGAPVQFRATHLNGSLYLPIPNTLVSSIAFYATPGDARNEFSVAGFSFCRTCGGDTEVPEPASIMLFGTGLIAFARLRRRKA